MKKLLLPVILAVLGTGGGIGAGIALRPEPAPLDMAAENPCGDIATDTPAEAEVGPAREYARLNNQFVIPVVEDGRVSAIVVMSLNLEVTPGAIADVFAAEPKLRDGFLQDMFDHANIGGFSGNFTAGTNMRALRNELLQTARSIMGSPVTDVLITDIVRQDS